jgi:glycosyltransferase involved in cell wall biosynthesis
MKTLAIRLWYHHGTRIIEGVIQPDMSKVLIIWGDTVDLNMGGVGVRAWEMACALSEDLDVTLAVPNPTNLHSTQFHLISYDLNNGDLRSYCKGVDVIVTHGFVLHFHPYLRQLGIPLAVDLYVPNLLESLVWHAGDVFDDWIPAYQEYLRVQSELIRAGDYFFCASERQRDYWLGWLHALLRVNPHTYADDTTFRRLIDTVPFGIPPGKPERNGAVLKGVHPGIAVDDRLIIWSGGLWDWLDPLTLIKAMKNLNQEYPHLKLYFLGTKHPNPTVNGMQMPSKTIEMAQQLGLYNRTVFFGEWVPYLDRSKYLAESDLSVVTHLDHIETHFSFRTRVLDCIWAEIPLVISRGDSLAELVEREHIGKVVRPGDVDELTHAIVAINRELDEDRYSSSFANVKENFRWNKVLAPLHHYCQKPYIAPDKNSYLTDLERISRDKDAFLEQVVHEKDAHWQQIVDDRDATIKRYQSTIPFRLYRMLMRMLGR